jgi:tRNA(Arg) A34 adenosine deaminase TadA
MRNNDYMQMALQLAHQAAQADEVPVGAVVVAPDGQVIGQAENAMRRQRNPAAHAEMLALQMAAAAYGDERLRDCDLYVTLEPCTMCAAATSLYRVRRIYFGAYDPKGGGIDHGARVFTQPTCHHRPETYGGILEMECQKLLVDFFQARR